MTSRKLAELEAHNEQLVKSLNHLMAQNISAENLLNELLGRTNPRGVVYDSLVSKIHTLHMHYQRQLHDQKHVIGCDLATGPDQTAIANMVKGKLNTISQRTNQNG